MGESRMRGLLVSLLVAASLAVAPAAIGKTAPAAMTSTGTVRVIDSKLCTVTIANMGVFVFGKHCNFAKITVGEWVTVTWTKNGSMRDATRIVAAAPLKIKDMWLSHMH